MGRHANGGKRAGGSGYSVLVGRTMVNASELDDVIVACVRADLLSLSILTNIEDIRM
jgi:hypothetical protein